MDARTLEQRLAAARAALAHMDDSSDESEGEEKQVARKAPAAPAAVPSPTPVPAPAPAAAPAAVPSPAAPSAPSPAPASISLSAPNSSLKFRLTLSTKPSAPVGEEPRVKSEPASDPSPPPSVAASRPRRQSRVKEEEGPAAAVDTATVPTHSASPRKRSSSRSSSKGSSSARKRSKLKREEGEDAQLAARVDANQAAQAAIVETWQWLQCDEPMCGKWRKLKEGQFGQSDLAFSSSAGSAGLVPPRPLPSFLSPHPLTFAELSGGRFFCHMSPDLAYARCAAEEELTQGDEVELAVDAP